MTVTDAAASDGAAGIRGAARVLALDAAAVATVRALAERGIASLLLKGPAVAHRLFPDDPDRRPYRDVDLLVAPATFSAAEAALAGLGYRAEIEGPRHDNRVWHEMSWMVPGPVPLTIDLHRSFAGVGDPGAFWAALWATAEQLSVAGEDVPVPGAAAATLLLALHAAAPGSSPQPAAELTRALDVLPAPLWTGAAEMARTCAAESAYAVGLRVVPGGAALARRLGLPSGSTAALWLSAHPASATAATLAGLSALPTMRARLRHLGRLLLPTPGDLYHRDAHAPEPRHSRVRLGRAYLDRLGQHIVGLPRGMVELRAATRLAQAPDRPHGSRPVRTAFAALGRGDTSALRAGAWALRNRRRARRQLAFGLDRVALRPAPAGGATAGRAVDGVLRWTHSTCLERELVRQTWFAGQGISRELVIGVTAPAAGFHAHAWLDGDRPAGAPPMTEILHRGVSPASPRRDWTHSKKIVRGMPAPTSPGQRPAVTPTEG